METNFNFKSSVCTSREQSERLLALGLKKETADMVYSYEREEHENNYYWKLDILESSWDSYIWPSNGTFVPAWSLGRLLSLIPKEFEVDVVPMCGRNYKMPIELHILPDLSIIYTDLSKEDYKGFYYESIYDSLISCIEWQVEQGYFPKEYLV